MWTSKSLIKDVQILQSGTSKKRWGGEEKGEKLRQCKQANKKGHKLSDWSVGGGTHKRCQFPTEHVALKCGYETNISVYEETKKEELRQQQ